MKKSRDIRSGQKNELLRWLVYIPNETHYESGFRPEQDPITHGKRLDFGLKVLKLSGKIEAHQKNRPRSASKPIVQPRKGHGIFLSSSKKNILVWSELESFGQ
jgi:hypothetical protein